MAIVCHLYYHLVRISRCSPPNIVNTTAQNNGGNAWDIQNQGQQADTTNVMRSAYSNLTDISLCQGVGSRHG